MNSRNTPTEDARCAFLHGLCQEIDSLRAAGYTVAAALRRARRRRRVRLFIHGHMSFGALRDHYYRWRKSPSPEVHRRRYRLAGGFARRIPIALLVEFLNRMAGVRIVPAATVLQSLRVDWKMGRPLPGLGTWREYRLRTGGEQALRSTAPHFPFSRSALYAALAADVPSEYARRISAALQAQRDLARFYSFVDRQRAALEKRRARESLGTPISQQQ